MPSMMFIPLDVCSPMASVVAQEVQQQSQQFLGVLSRGSKRYYS